MIGDPSGRSSERQLITREQVEANVGAIREQLGRFLDFSGAHAARLLDNAEWLLRLGAVDLMRDVGKHFTVNYMLQKESVQTRLASESGISYTEFSYMLLQAYDFLELHRREGVTLQVGGSDQWGNMTAGTALVRKAAGAEAHVVTFPLVTNAAGTKFGKTEGGTSVWLDGTLTSPYKFYQFWIQVDDRDAGRYLRYFTLLPREEVEALERAAAERPERREAQQALARDVTGRVHGPEAARASEEVSALLFGGGDAAGLSPAALELLRAEVPYAELSGGNGALDALDLFVDAKLVASRGAAKRLLEQGGIYVNGRRVMPADRAVGSEALLHGGHLLLRKGAREYALVRVK
jgi:tyrosyl-tRNA synthetase